MRTTAGRLVGVAVLVLVLVLGTAWGLARLPVGVAPPGNSAPIDDNHPPGWEHAYDRGQAGHDHGPADRARPTTEDGPPPDRPAQEGTQPVGVPGGGP